MSDTIHKLTVPLANTRTTNVTCFNDRAEITREIALAEQSTGAGSYEVCVEGLTAKIDADSIRVKAADGCKVTINEVAFEVHQKLISDLTGGGGPGAGGVDAKRAELAALSQAAAVLGAELSRAKEQRKLIDGYVRGMLLPQVGGGKDGAATAPAADSIASVEQLLAFHAGKCAASDADVLRLEDELKTANAAVEVAKGALSRLENPSKPRTKASRDVSVLVQVSEAAAKAGFRLHMTYMVEGASWSPSYDIRVDTSGAKAELMLAYFGMAMMMASNACMRRELSCDALEIQGSESDDGDDGSAEGVAQSTVSEGGGGTACFAIERPVSIEADSKPHKVTIVLLAFEPQLLYFGTPSLEPAFYLQVKAKNTSSFPLLASSKVSVFLDGSFITTSCLKDVSPSEEFTTFLGADASLKLEHQQLARERKTHGGAFSSKTQSTSHRFVSKIHNTKAVPARLTVVEVLPKSTEDKIKVELLAPAPRELAAEGEKGKEAKEGDYVQQNKVSNNIVWQLTLAPGAKRELAFEYVVTWPTDKELSSYDYQG